MKFEQNFQTQSLHWDGECVLLMRVRVALPSLDLI